MDVRIESKVSLGMESAKSSLGFAVFALRSEFQSCLRIKDQGNL